MLFLTECGKFEFWTVSVSVMLHLARTILYRWNIFVTYAFLHPTSRVARLERYLPTKEWLVLNLLLNMCIFDMSRSRTVPSQLSTTSLRGRNSRWLFIRKYEVYKLLLRDTMVVYYQGIHTYTIHWKHLSLQMDALRSIVSCLEEFRSKFRTSVREKISFIRIVNVGTNKSLFVSVGATSYVDWKGDENM